MRDGFAYLLLRLAARVASPSLQRMLREVLQRGLWDVQDELRHDATNFGRVG